MRFFLRGLAMGLAYIAPIGPQNLFVIHSALGSPRRRALLTAWIVIFFDVTLALACFFGAGAVMGRYRWLERFVLLAGGLFVVYSGIRLVRSRAPALDMAAPPDSLPRTAAFACVVTWFNPQAILSGTMMLGASRAALPAGQALPFILGTASASCLWFTGLTVLLSVFRRRLRAGVLRGISAACGVVLIFCGGQLLLGLR